MKPVDLKVPFEWENRQIMIDDHIWYVPGYQETAQAFTFPGWSDPSIFEKNQPVVIEYCSGNGAWIVEKAKAHPEINWVALEIKFQRARKIWAKIKNLQLPNLFVICGEGRLVTHKYIENASMEHVYINFPDPWPKTKHIKNRIIQESFVAEIARILKPGGYFTFVTDDTDYSEWTIDITLRNPNLISCNPSPFFSNEWIGYGTSFFEQLWREKGKDIRYHQFKKSS
jgi:tRNA (guanine-N7-)-methyltransferase